MNRPTLCVMVGLAGSGKSTYAEMRNQNAKYAGRIETIESSDQWRLKLYNDINDQTHNEEVFKAMQQSTVEKLKRGEDVIYDATNLKIKDRKKLLDLVKDIYCEKICAIVATPIETCIAQDKERERSVGEHVIRRQLANFQMPFQYEGWHDIVILNQRGKMSYEDLLNKMNNFEQKNKHHDFDLLTHCYLTGLGMIKELCDAIPTNRDLIMATSLHDIGKLFTQTFSDDGQAHYFNHANVGAYYVLCYGDIGEINLKNVCMYINYHMLPYDWKTDKAQNKWEKLFGRQTFKELLLIHKYDDSSQKRREVEC